MATQGGQGGLRRKVVAAGFGNLLEWYDFGVYGFFAVTLGKQFFPQDDPTASLLAAFAAFAVGYGARPVGGLVLGHVGDKYGRKPVMMVSMAAMGLTTFAIGLLPGYQTIGLAAPILLVLLRLLQGFAVAGEYSSSTIFLLEHAPAERRAFISSWALSGQFLGLLMGSGMGALMGAVISDGQMQDWGWRVPFLFGVVISAVGLVWRRNLTETPAIEESAASEGSPVVEAFRTAWRSIVCYICLILMGGVGFYVAFVYAVSDLTLHMHLSTARALDINTLALLVIMVTVPIAGLLADRIGRKPLALFTALGTLVFAWPLWWLIHQNDFALILLGQTCIGVVFALGWTVYSLMMAETLPPRLRCSVLSIGNGVAYGVFGGLTPLVSTYLVERTGDDFAPVYLMMAFALLSFLAVLRLPETLARTRATP
jgi:MHS family proline/betaine transporter-like MFS transporter